MARIECDVTTIDGVSLVTCRLASETTVRVTVEPIHDGPIWPPRRQGVPAAGWDDGTWAGLVEAGVPRALGYATPADPGEADGADDTDAPVRIASVEPAEDDPAVTPRAVVRSLGDPSPTRDAVPLAADAPSTDAAPSQETPEPTAVDRASGAPSAAEDTDAPEDADHGDPREATTDASTPATGPETVAGAARLDAIEDRLDTAAELAAVDTPAAARTAVADAGGIEAVRTLVEQLDADRAYLQRVRERTGSLAERAETTSVPLAALERLA